MYYGQLLLTLIFIRLLKINKKKTNALIEKNIKAMNKKYTKKEAIMTK